MHQEFVLKDGVLHETSPASGTIAVFSAPTDAERRVLHALGIDEHTLDSALDPEEISRVEFDQASGRTMIIWKRPDPKADGDATRFELTSVGFFLDGERLTVVVAEGRPPISDRFAELDTPTEVMLRMMLVTVEEFVGRLRNIKRTAGEIQARLNRTLDNRALVRMFDLSEDLLYYVDAIDANGAVMTRLRGAADRLELTAEDRALLEDLVIDNTQCSRQGEIYTKVLGGLLDARGNIVNNNMNVLIKNLTVVNVVFLPLGVIASMGGMSEFTMMLDDYSVDWRVGYPVFVLMMLVVGLALWRAIKGWILRVMDDERPRSRPQGTVSARP